MSIIKNFIKSIVKTTLTKLERNPYSGLKINKDYQMSVHYQMNPSRYKVQCGNGSFHVKRTLDKRDVTCPLCLKEIK